MQNNGSTVHSELRASKRKVLKVKALLAMEGDETIMARTADVGADGLRDVATAPDRQRIVIGDKTKRFQSCAVQAAGQQHAQRLVRQSAFEWIDHDVVSALARKCFDQNIVWSGNDRAFGLQLQPV